MPNIHIYGLPPINVLDTRVELFDEQTFNSDKAIKLYKGAPDEKGMVNCNIDEKYIENGIRLVTKSEMFEEIIETLKVPTIGVFHTVSLTRDLELYSVTDKLPIEIISWERDAQEQMKQDYRDAKYKNYISKTIYWLLIVGSPILGLFVAGIPGIVIGVLITIVTIALDKYASGHKHGI